MEVGTYLLHHQLLSRIRPLFSFLSLSLSLSLQSAHVGFRWEWIAFKHVQPFMNSIVHFSRSFSVANQSQTLIFFTKELCDRLLDRYPDIKTLKKVHSRIVVDHHLHSDPSSGVKLMRAYSSCGDITTTRKLFDGSPHRNVVFFNVMIRSYINNDFYDEAILVYQTMEKLGFSSDHYTYPCVLKACSATNNLRLGLQIHCSVLGIGLDSNLFIGNGLISMYGKCGCLKEARQMLDEMPIRDVVSWNSMVAGYAQNTLFDDAFQICREMESLNFKPDIGTMASLLPAVSNTSSDNISYVHEMFMNLGKKSLVSWNVMIAIYVNNSMPAEAVDLFVQMEACQIEPDAITISSLFPACGDLSAVLLGRRLHEYIERKKLRPNLLLENALIDMYAKCGCLQAAMEVFEKMRFKDVVSWTSLISAHGKCGEGRAATMLFMAMQESGLSPDSISFVSVLSACSHAGLLNEGRYFFRLMTERYSIIPTIEHFACMVDLLGRGGLVEEAYSFIEKMPMDPNERVWGALLSACRVYSDMKIGIQAADCLLRLAPKESGYYVLLSNIYAKAGRWQHVAEIRSIMKDRKIKKLPGISNIELNDRVYTFLAGDQSHVQSKDIYEELDVLVGKMKEMGYVPETDSALHDIEEEDKEQHLAVHSEKLAIVFAILTTDPGTQIRITKNLRVCGDCHVAAKLISKITCREIVVRDTQRFHHFNNGICSCGDYW